MGPANRDPWQGIEYEKKRMSSGYFFLTPFLQSHLAGYISVPEGHCSLGSLPYLTPCQFRYRDSSSSFDSNTILLCSSWFPYILPTPLVIVPWLRKPPQVILISVCHLFLCQDPEWYKSHASCVHPFQENFLKSSSNNFYFTIRSESDGHNDVGR